MSAIERISMYLARREKARGIDKESIHGFDFGPDCGIELRASDLRTLLDKVTELRQECDELAQLNTKLVAQLAEINTTKHTATDELALVPSDDPHRGEFVLAPRDRTQSPNIPTEDQLGTTTVDLKKALEVLQELEWCVYNFDRYGEGQFWCPACGSMQSTSHEPDCKLNAVLTACVGGDKPTDEAAR